MNKYRCVLYVEGGCLPNPGSWGSGIHGYVYNIEEHDAIKAKKYSDKPNGRIMTTDGYKLAFDTKFEDVIPEYYINGYVSSDLEGTNNIAELTAIVESIKYILSNIDTIPIREVLFKTDSEYCIAVCNNIIKNDNKAVDNTRPNYAYWVKIAELLTQLKDNNITFNITYVKGHSDSLGNHLADRLATMGRVESAAGNNCVDIQITPAKGYWKYTNPVRHPFLQYRQLYFLNTLNIPGVTTYGVMKYSKDDEPGTKSHEASFGLVILNDEPEYIGSVIKKFQTQRKSINVTSTVNLDSLYKQHTSIYNKLFGSKIFIYDTGSKSLCTMLEIPVVSEIHPVGLATKAMEKIYVLNKYIEAFKSNTNNPAYIFKDITELFFTTGDKNKKKITISNNDKVVTVTEKIKDSDIKVNIEIGKDIIDRNHLAKLIDFNPKITLVLLRVSELCIEYYVIIELDNGDISIWCNYYSNQILL